MALFKTTGAQFTDMHLVGHSLGAHIAGYAGHQVKGIGRITGKYRISHTAFGHT